METKSTWHEPAQTALKPFYRMSLFARAASARIFLLCMLALMMACTPAPQAEIRIGSNIWAGYEPLYLARSLDWLEGSGIRLIDYPSSTETISALRRGSIEAGALTLDEVISLMQDGIDLRVLLVMDVSSGADAVVAQPGIGQPANLRGLRIGVESGAVGGYMLERMLEISGLSLQDVQIIPLKLDEHEAAFAEQRVDAVITFEPVKSRLIARGGQSIFDSSLIPGEIIDVLAVRTEVLRTSPHAFDTLIEHWFKALDYMRRQPDDAALRMQPRLKLPPAQLNQLFATLQLGDRELNRSFFDNSTNPPVNVATHLMQVMRRNGLLQHDVDVSRLFMTKAHGPD